MLDVNKLANIEAITTKREIKTRTYTRKKTGETVTYTNVYAKSALLFKKTKTGYKLQDTAWQQFENSIIKEFGKEEGFSIVNEARRIKDDILNKKDGISIFGSSSKHYHSKGRGIPKEQRGWNRIDVHSFISRIAIERAEKFLINMGITPAELINYIYQETGLTVSYEELVNEGNWNNITWNGPTEEGPRLTVTIEFNYNGVTHAEITKE